MRCVLWIAGKEQFDQSEHVPIQWIGAQENIICCARRKEGLCSRLQQKKVSGKPPFFFALTRSNTPKIENDVKKSWEFSDDYIHHPF